MSLLKGPSAKQAEMMYQELGHGEDDLKKGVQNLLDMCAASPHLPQPEFVERNLLEQFVRGCRMDPERARRKFEAYCLSRSRHRDMFEYHSLNEPPLNHTSEFIDIIPMPNLTDEGCRVTIYRLKPNYPEGSDDVAMVTRMVLLIGDCRMHDETHIAGDVFVWETSHMRASLVARFAANFNFVRRGVHLAHHAYPQRMKRIHVVGAPPFFASSLQLIRNCSGEKIRKRFYIHAKVDELLDHIPARVLPAEFGGTEESINFLAQKWRRRIDELKDFYRNLSQYTTSNETINDDEMYGAAGAFRKLDID